jgi:hypothetical protein
VNPSSHAGQDAGQRTIRDSARGTDLDRLLDDATALRRPRIVDRWIVGDQSAPRPAVRAPSAPAEGGPAEDGPESTCLAAGVELKPCLTVTDATGALGAPGSTTGSNALIEHLAAQHSERLGDKMVRQIDSYRPQDISERDFAAIESFVKDVVAQTADLRHKDPLAHVHAVTSYVHWAHNLHGRPLDAKAIFTAPLILHFTERVLVGKSDGYVSTYRSRLMRAGRDLGVPSMVPMPVRQRRSVNNPPYTDTEMARFQIAAASLGNAYRRRSTQLVVACSAGAGLNPTDYVRLRNRHITLNPHGLDTGVLIDVPESAGTSRTSLKPRKVLLLRRYEPLLFELMTAPGLDPDAFLIWPNVSKTRENLHSLTQNLLRSLSDPANRPAISRLRTTWIVQHLTWGTPTTVLLEASGLNSAESLHRYMDYVPKPDWDSTKELIRGPEGPEALR